MRHNSEHEIRFKARFSRLLTVLIVFFGATFYADSKTKLSDLTLSPDQFGIVSTKDTSIKLLKEQMKGYRFVKKTWKGEGEIIEGYEVFKGEEHILNALTDKAFKTFYLLSIFSKNITTSIGIRVGDTFEKIAKKVKGLKCTHGMTIDGSTDCKCFSPDLDAIEFHFEDLKTYINANELGKVHPKELRGKKIVSIDWTPKSLKHNLQPKTSPKI